MNKQDIGLASQLLKRHTVEKIFLIQSKLRRFGSSLLLLIKLDFPISTRVDALSPIG